MRPQDIQPSDAKPVHKDQRYSAISRAAVWLMVVLMVVPAGLDYSDLTPDYNGNAATRMVLAFILLAGAYIAFSRVPVLMRTIKGTNPYFWCFLALAFLSVIWSIDPELTARRLFRLLVQLGAVLALALAAWQTDRFQKLLRPVLTALLAGSLIFGLVRPDLAIHQEISPELFHSWHGLTMQKNILGALASIGTIFWVQAWLSRSASRLGLFFGLGSSVACLLLSRSSTSAVGTLFACLTMVLMMRTPGSMRRSMPYAVTALSATILLYALAMIKVVPGLEILLSPIPMITGKDLTFSGRSEIWAAIVSHIELRPWFGSGFGAYWGGPFPGTESYSIKLVLNGFYPGSAHNGYLDIINDLGVAGFILLMMYVLRYGKDAILLYRTDRAQAALYIGLFMQQAIGNLSESGWFNVTKIEFVILCMATVCLGRTMAEQRRTAQLRRKQASRPPVSGRADT